jgi:2-polyprenyl-6-methoxyphenol hydroxylase-like FAD-dependent oxidoreductase
MGALGLNSGMLDADALAEALIMVLNEGRSDNVLDVYSDERRKVFQFFVDPTSSQNKIRVHSHHPDTAAQDDWYFRILTNNPTKEQMLELMKPYFETWRTHIRKAAAGV